jgi:hypothetical protein
MTDTIDNTLKSYFDGLKSAIAVSVGTSFRRLTRKRKVHNAALVSSIPKAVWIDASLEAPASPAPVLLDRSGNGADFTNDTSGKRGSITSNAINGLSALTLDFNQFVYCKNNNFKTPPGGKFQIFCVGSYVGPTSSIYTGALFGMANNGGQPIVNLIPYDKTQFGSYMAYSSGSWPPWVEGGNFTGFPFNGPAIYEVTRIGKAFRGYVNGHLRGTFEEPWEAGVMNEVYLGRNTFDPTTNNTMPCVIGEFIVCTDISSEHRVLIEGYLAWKWGLVAQLPHDHKYKKVKP